MSEVIQKITLYDLLGYTVPGTILVSVYIYLFYLKDHLDLITKYGQFAGYLFAALIVSGYICGLAIAEVFAILCSLPVKSKWFAKGNGIENIGYDNISDALARAGILKDPERIQDLKSTMKYMGYMYGIIQTDSKYTRLHNYASLELVCGNMAIVSIACFGLYAYAAGRWQLVIIGLLIGCIFFANYHKLYWRKHFYVLCWFVEKYSV